MLQKLVATEEQITSQNASLAEYIKGIDGQMEGTRATGRCKCTTGRYSLPAGTA